MRRIILLRHGRTPANDERLYCGSTDISLSQRGREELIFLRENCRWPDISGFRAITSGLRRTEETLSILFGDIPFTCCEDLREIDFGAFEMHSYEQLKDDPAYRAWCDGDNEGNIPPGGESGRQMQARVLRSFRELCAAGDDLLIVSHGGPIAAIMAELFPAEGKNRFEWQPENGRGYLLEGDGVPSAWIKIPYGGDSHG